MIKTSTAVVIAAVACLVGGCGSSPPKPVVTAEPSSPLRKAAETPPEPPKSIERPLVRQKSLTATGYAVISVQNHKLPAQQRLMAIRAAKADAYRNLAEQVYGLLLESSTSVSDLAVTSDRFRARVEGTIFGAMLTSITPVNNDTYEVTLTLDGSVVSDIRALYVESQNPKAGR